MKQFLEDRDESTLPIRTKYNTKAASLYKDKVKCSFNTHLNILHDQASEFAQMCFNTTQFLLQILVESQGGTWDEANSPAQKMSFQSSSTMSSSQEPKISQTRSKTSQSKNDTFYSDFDDLPSGMARSNTVDGGFDSYQNSG